MIWKGQLKFKDEFSERSERTDKEFWASNNSDVCEAAQNKRGPGIGQTGVAFGANYGEAYRGRSKPEFISKCGDCLKEIEETAYWLELLVDSRIVSGEKLAALRQEITELTAIFVTIIKRSKE